VLVDASLRSSDPRIFAVGDVANAQHPVLGRRIRVEHWANALHQPEVVAKSVLGQDAVYDRLPYFFTDQYDLGMEYVGYADADDEVVVRGDLDGREFVALWVRDGRVVAGMNVNVWDVTDRIRDIILAGQPADAFELPAPSA
jgi:NADPH-dependent 2,4-dienoyl-CoA reductase/sulfur reductase-like enzyme